MNKLYSFAKNILLFVFLLICLPHLLLAQRGAPDSSFGLNGKVITTINGLSLKASGVALQTDQKIVVSCYDNNNASSNFIVMRFNLDGSKDVSFGNNGVATIPFTNNFSSKANALYIQPDSKILIGGTVNIGSPSCDFGIVRLKLNGTLDSSFGNNGVQTLSIGNGSAYDNLSALAMQRNGAIIATGFAAPQDGEFNNIVLCRFKNSGATDSTFGTNGKIIKSIYESGHDYAYALAVLPDDKILVTGFADSSYEFLGIQYFRTKEVIAILKYTKNGAPDTTFGNHGIVTTNADAFSVDSTSTSKAFDITFQKDNKIIVAGSSWVPRGQQGAAVTDFCLLRYMPNGNLDSSFGKNGITRSIKKNREVHIARSVVVMPDKKIIAAGYGGRSGFFTDFNMVNYRSNGNADITFGNNGLVATDLGSNNDVAIDMTVQSDNKIILAGYTIDSITNQYVVVLSRYNYNALAAQVIAAKPLIEESKTVAIKLYPNPATDVLHITGISANAMIIITNNAGKTMGQLTANSTSHNYNISALPAGIYYLTITKDSKAETLKFVKQ